MDAGSQTVALETMERAVLREMGPRGRFRFRRRVGAATTDWLLSEIYDTTEDTKQLLRHCLAEHDGLERIRAAESQSGKGIDAWVKVDSLIRASLQATQMLRSARDDRRSRIVAAFVDDGAGSARLEDIAAWTSELETLARQEVLLAEFFGIFTERRKAIVNAVYLAFRNVT